MKRPLFPDLMTCFSWCWDRHNRQFAQPSQCCNESDKYCRWLQPTAKKKKTSKQLKKRNLQINEEKTKNYPVRREGNEKWKTCKLVGSILDTEKDMNRRKTLALCAHIKLKYIPESKKNTIKIKVKVFNAFVRSIFMYNSELRTLTKKLENTVNIFQRLLLRRIINVKWPNKDLK